MQTIKLKTLTAYSKNGEPKCVCCGKAGINNLCLHHIHCDGNKKRKAGQPTGGKLYLALYKLGFPLGEFETNCHNCNNAKMLFGKCPHEKQREMNHAPTAS